MKRLETPIRKAKCLHIEAVDLKSLIHLLPFKDKVNLKQDSAACMQCLICRLNGPLLKDGFILKFLEDFKRCIVEIDRKGQAVEVEQWYDTIIDWTESFNSSCCLFYHYKHFHSSKEEKKEEKNELLLICIWNCLKMLPILFYKIWFWVCFVQKLNWMLHVLFFG